MYFDSIAKIVSERTGCDVSSVKPESKFSELGIDSLDTVELLMNLEDEIGIEIELEEEPVNTLTLSRYRKVALRLKSTLEEYGISDIVESVDGKRRIVMDRVDCDLYNYLSGKEEYSQLFQGNYLTNYSWGETTLGGLLNNPAPKSPPTAP